MTIVNVTRRFTRRHWGGTESVVIETGKRLRRRGHDVSIQTTTALDSVREETIDGIPLERHRYVYPYIGLGNSERQQLDYNGGNLVSPSLALRVSRIKRPDILHLHTQGRLGGSVRLSARLRSIPYLVSLHGGVAALPDEIKTTLAEPVKGAIDIGKPIGALVGSRHVLRDAAAALCLNTEEERHLNKLYPHLKTHFLPHGVDISTFGSGDAQRFRDNYGINENDVVILSVGNIYPQKNQLTLLRAFASLAATRPDIVLVLIGVFQDAKYQEKVESNIRSLNIESQVRVIVDARPDNRTIPDALKACRTLVCTSTYETFAIVVLEAWAAKRAVIAPDIGGIKDLLRDGENGMTYPVNDEHALTAQLRCLIDDGDMAYKFGQVGYRDVETHYQWDHVTHRLMNIYEGLRR